MTLRQLLSDEVMMWIHNKNLEIKEGAEYSKEDIITDFTNWFNQNRNIINESLIKESHDDEDIISEDENNEDINNEDENNEDINNEDNIADEEDEEIISDDEGSDVQNNEDDERRGTNVNYNDRIGDELPDEKEEDIREDPNEENDFDNTTDDIPAPENEEIISDDDDVAAERIIGDEPEDSNTEEETAITPDTDTDNEFMGMDYNRHGSSRLDRTMDDMMDSVADNPDSTVIYRVNDGSDATRNIFSVVESWYKKAVSKGMNKDEVTSLYFLDTSNVKNMTALFAFTNVPDIDISSWNTSNVKFMEGMFYKSTFNNKSILNWDVSSCVNFRNMFYGSKFSYNIDNWTPGTVQEIVYDENTGEPVRVEGEIQYEPVPAELPFVGAREDDNRRIKEERVLKALKAMDDQIEAEKERRNRRNQTQNNTTNESLKNIISFEDFIGEGFGDFIKKGIKKVKSFLNTISVKLNDFYYGVFSADGNLMPAISPYTSMNYIATNNVPGVQIVTNSTSKLLVPDARNTQYVNNNDEKYDFIKPNTREWENYKTFIGAINEHYEATGEMLFETAMPLTAKGSGVGVTDITSKDLKRLLRQALLSVPAYKKKGGKTLCIFGAPGIGKSTIPKAIVREYNSSLDDANKGRTKSVMVVNCGDLTLDGFYLPLPEYTKLDDIAKSHPKIYDILQNSGVDAEKLRRTVVKKTMEAPKTWLPCYAVTADTEQNKVCNDIANGYIFSDNVFDEESQSWVEVQNETTEGGILLFDEFFRADPEVFKILMQIVLDRRTQGGMAIGNKWAIVCCSNRPNDDDEVKASKQGSSPVLGNRFLEGAYNFVPDFEDWAEWATSEHILDPVVKIFLTAPTPPDSENANNPYDIDIHDADTDKDVKLRSYHRWHSVDPKLYKSVKDDSVFMFPTPRTWTALLEWIKDEKDDKGVSSVLDLKPGYIREKARGVIGIKTADDLVDFIIQIKDSGLNINKIFNDPNYIIDSGQADVYMVVELVRSYITDRWNSGNRFPLTREVPMFVNMFNFFKKVYEDYDVGGTTILTLHNDIVRNILKIKSTSDAKIKRMKPYLDLVMGTDSSGVKYGVKYRDQAI